MEHSYNINDNLWDTDVQCLETLQYVKRYPFSVEIDPKWRSQTGNSCISVTRSHSNEIPMANNMFLRLPDSTKRVATSADINFRLQSNDGGRKL